MTQPDKWALEKAAQLWCLDQHEDKPMDVEFAKSIALALMAERAKEREACAKVADTYSSYVTAERIRQRTSSEERG